MNLRRKILRWQLRNGKISEAQYRRSLRRINVGEEDDRVNAPLRRWVWGVCRELNPFEITPVALCLRNLLAQAFLREVVYHPTKGYRYRRGEPVEAWA